MRAALGAYLVCVVLAAVVIVTAAMAAAGHIVNRRETP